MIEVARIVAVRAPADAVVAYLSDWGNSVEWDPATITCRQVDDGPVGVGTQWRSVVRLLGRRVVIGFRLDEVGDHRVVVTAWNRGASAVDTVLCRALSPGRTSITYHSRVALHGGARVAAPLMRRELERVGDDLTERLTAVLERARPR